jgi:uncharacterized membrane protein YbhN (UPF0104 family)
MREILRTVLKILVVAGCLVYLMSRLTNGPAPSNLVEPAALLAAIVVNQIALTLFAVRMRAVLSLIDIDLTFRDSIRIHLQSMFYFFVVPMTVGLELARFLKIRSLAPKADGLKLGAALVFDRLVGAGCALLIALVLLAFMQLPLITPSPLWALAALGGAAIAFFAARTLPRLRQAAAVSLALGREHPGRLLGIVAISIVMHVTSAIAILLAAGAFGIAIDLLQTLFAVCGGMILMVLPVAFGGFGPADAGATGLLILLGQPPGVAVTVAALIFAARLIGGIEGGIWEIADSGVEAISRVRTDRGERQDQVAP